MGGLALSVSAEAMPGMGAGARGGGKNAGIGA